MPIHTLCQILRRVTKRWRLTRQQAQWRKEHWAAYRVYLDEKLTGTNPDMLVAATKWLRHCQRQVWTIREELRGMA